MEEFTIPSGIDDIDINDDVDIDAFIEIISNSPTEIVDNKVFIAGCYLVKTMIDLSIEQKSDFIEALVNGSKELMSEINNSQDNDKITLRNAVKMFIFIHSNLITTLEALNSSGVASQGNKKRKKNSEWKWEDFKEMLCGSVLSIMECPKTFQLWPLSSPEEAVGNLVLNIATKLLDDPINVRNKAMSLCIVKLSSISIVKFRLQLRACSTFINSIMKFEHVIIPVVSMLSMISDIHKSNSLMGDMLIELGRVNSQDLARDMIGAKNISSFLAALTEKNPRFVQNNLSVILNHLDSESYTIRNGILQVIAQIIESNAHPKEVNEECKETDIYENKEQDDKDNEEEINVSEKNVDSLFDIIFERVHDVTSYTRSKTLQIWTQLIESDSVKMKYFNKVGYIAKERLQDKSSIVRKNAIILLTSLLRHNPFAGKLKSESYKARLEVINKEIGDLEANMESKSNEENNEGKAQVIVFDEQLYLTKKREHIFLSTALEFISQIEICIPILAKFLSSNVNSDILETIDFFLIANQFSIENSSIGLNQMLHLIWSQDDNIKKAIISTYNTILLQKEKSSASEGISQEKQDFITALTLVNQVKGANVAILTSFEELIKQLVRDKSITTGIIKALLEIFSMRLAEVTNDQSLCAEMVLSMIGTAKPEVLIQNSKLLIEVGFENHKGDEKFLRSTCVALQKIAYQVKDNQLDIIMKYITEFLTFNNEDKPSDMWFKAADEAIKMIFTIHPNPERYSEDLLKKASSHIFITDNKISSIKLAKFFFILGHISLKTMVIIEELESKIKKNKINSTETANNQVDEKLQAEFGMGGSDDYELEMLREKAERNMVTKNLISIYSPMVSHICSSPNKYTDHILQTSALLCLCKLMLCNYKFCDDHLQLLFTISKVSSNPKLRTSAIIALGDIAFRFPSLIDPWTKMMYNPLSDEDPSVRKNTLLVLTHLILNDMIKVKGEISEIAVCLEDLDSGVSNLAHLFFSELAKKGKNPIYNILPDTVSRLTHCERINSTQFHNIMHFLISFIDKDKQTESLIEKLCHRFLATNEVTHWRDIAFCLSQLNYSEKCVKKFLDLSKTYKDKLHDSEVYECFETIFAKSKKVVKNEDIKIQLEDFEKILADLHEKQAEDFKTAEKAHKVMKIRKLKKSSHTNTKNTKLWEDSEDESDIEKIEQKEPSPEKVTRKGRKVKKKSKPKQIELEDSEESEYNEDSECENINPNESTQLSPEKFTKSGRKIKKRLKQIRA